MTSNTRRTAVISAYYFVVGGGLMIAGWRTSSWRTETIGLAFLVIAAATLAGQGEWTTWLRGERDERRKQAADHAFRTAFFVLAGWIGGVSIYAGSHTVGTEVWGAGNAVAVAAAIADYALVLRRT